MSRDKFAPRKKPDATRVYLVPRYSRSSNGEGIFHGHDQAQLTFEDLEWRMHELSFNLVWERVRTAFSLSVRSGSSGRLAVQRRQVQVRSKADCGTFIDSSINSSSW